MREKIQAQFLNEVSGNLYYEIYFKIINENGIEFSEYERIKEMIYLELNKIQVERGALSEASVARGY